MGRTAEGRSELAELADESASSADATIPPSPARGARSMTGRQSVPLCLECGEEMAVIGQRCAQAKPSREPIPTSRIGADPFDTEHRLEASQGAGESRETNAESRTF